jgi:hypothetical protein
MEKFAPAAFWFNAADRFYYEFALLSLGVRLRAQFEPVILTLLLHIE